MWVTQQFSKKIVGLANATAGGWGNLGGGITNLTMVFIFEGTQMHVHMHMHMHSEVHVHRAQLLRTATAHSHCTRTNCHTPLQASWLRPITKTCPGASASWCHSRSTLQVRPIVHT